MAAFDVTTKPVSLSLKPGATGSVMVVVSNRLGRPVMGLVQGALIPGTASGWLVPPPPNEAQKRYEADPAATANLEFKVAVPADAVAQDVQFKATVWDVLAPDDTKVEGQTVAIKITVDPKPDGGGKIPWWVWLIVAVVVVGAGIGIYLAVKPRGVPNVVGMTEKEATEKLTKAGFAPVTPVDTLVEQAGDSNKVVHQDPEAKTKLPTDTMVGKTPATITVTRLVTEVPEIVNQPLALAIDRLRDAGLKVLGDLGGRYTANQDLDDRIAEVRPEAHNRVRIGSGVTLVIYAYGPTRPPTCRFNPRCMVGPKGDWKAEVERVREVGPRGPGEILTQP